MLPSPKPCAEPLRPFVEPNTVDHDDGVEGMTIARTHTVRRKGTYLGGVPAHIQAQVHKDKTTCSILVRLLQPFRNPFLPSVPVRLPQC